MNLIDRTSNARVGRSATLNRQKRYQVRFDNGLVALVSTRRADIVRTEDSELIEDNIMFCYQLEFLTDGPKALGDRTQKQVVQLLPHEIETIISRLDYLIVLAQSYSDPIIGDEIELELLDPIYGSFRCLAFFEWRCGLKFNVGTERLSLEGPKESLSLFRQALLLVTGR